VSCHNLAPCSEEQKEAIEDLIGMKESSAKAAVTAFLYLYSALTRSTCAAPPGQGLSASTSRPPAMDVLVKSGIPVGAGLGSSASYSVCISGGLALAVGVVAGLSAESRPLINSLAFLCEKIIHGNPSGIDNSVCTFGGACAYSKGAMTPLPKFQKAFQFLLVNTNVPKNTKEQVEKVRARRELFPGIVDPILDAIDAISLRFVQACREQAHASLEGVLGSLIDMNHSLLGALGASHPALEAVALATRRRALLSKITGAGGGGCALVFAPESSDGADVSGVRSDLRAQGFAVHEAQVGCGGVAGALLDGQQASVVSAAFQNSDLAAVEQFLIE
jgi:mevalonate kinase